MVNSCFHSRSENKRTFIFWDNKWPLPGLFFTALQELCSPWWRHQKKTFSALLAICEGEFTGHRWINGWVNNGEAGDLRRHRTHYDVTVMRSWQLTIDGKMEKYFIFEVCWFKLENGDLAVILLDDQLELKSHAGVIILIACTTNSDTALKVLTKYPVVREM